MNYSPLTDSEKQQILSSLGLSCVEDLFLTIPDSIKDQCPYPLNSMGESLSEHELREYFAHLAKQNKKTTHFLGGGLYETLIPSAVNSLSSRGEFLTSYTPYQPEMAQGTLQAIFEYQTMMSQITGMEISNASLYDGATALSEAVLMAMRLKRCSQEQVSIAANLPPEYLNVVRTFLNPEKLNLIPWDPKTGKTDIDFIQNNPTEIVVVGYPNYFGIIEDLATIRTIVPNSLLITSVADISALSLLPPPGEFGADIVTGEAQQLGNPVNMGGPVLGFLTTQTKYLRQLPGRITGQTTDAEGKRAFALTLSTREQHIRREKATSNICTNQGLIALRATIFLSLLGKQGFVELGTLNSSYFSYLKSELQKIGIKPTFTGECYREGVFTIPQLNQVFAKCLSKNFVPGIKLTGQNQHPELKETLLMSAHPKLTKTKIDAFIQEIKQHV